MEKNSGVKRKKEIVAICLTPNVKNLLEKLSQENRKSISAIVEDSIIQTYGEKFGIKRTLLIKTNN